LPVAALAQVKNVAVVETEVDAASGAAAEITSAEVRLITAGLRREAVKNLPRDKYNIMTSETVQAQGSAVLESCADENCVISLGAKIGADYIVRGIISKLRARFALSVEIYETENGNLVASSDLVSSENIVELVEKAAATYAEMYQTFAKTHRSTRKTPIMYTVAVNVNPTNGGAVSRNPDQTYYAPGTVVYVTATPANGYKFAGWSGGAAGTANPVTVTMDGDKTLTADFQYVQKTYTLTTNVSPHGGGTVVRNPDKEAYSGGERVTVTAVSADEYKFIDWTGAVTGKRKRLTVTMDGDKAVTANFYKKSVTAAATEEGDTADMVLVGYGFFGDPIYSNEWPKRPERPKRIKWTKEDYKADTTKNALFVDALPLIYSIGSMLATFSDLFGVGLQYERRLYEKLSFVGRYEYFGMWDSHPESGGESHIHSFETHARYYPTGKAFFVDGMLGYYVNTISGYEEHARDGYYSDGSYSYRYGGNYSYEGMYDIFKWGASLGWRIKFRKVGGLTWELSLGWDFAFNDYKKFDEVHGFEDRLTNYGIVDSYAAFMGGAGPRLVSAFGWRF